MSVEKRKIADGVQYLIFYSFYGKHVANEIQKLKRADKFNSSGLHNANISWIIGIGCISITCFIGIGINYLGFLIWFVLALLWRNEVIYGACMSRILIATCGVKSKAEVTDIYFRKAQGKVCEGWIIHLIFKSPKGVSYKRKEIVNFRPLYKTLEKWRAGDYVDVLYNPYSEKLFFPDFPRLLKEFSIKK